jgi:hypothetical protein
MLICPIHPGFQIYVYVQEFGWRFCHSDFFSVPLATGQCSAPPREQTAQIRIAVTRGLSAATFLLCFRRKPVPVLGSKPFRKTLALLRRCPGPATWWPIS